MVANTVRLLLGFLSANFREVGIEPSECLARQQITKLEATVAYVMGQAHAFLAGRRCRQFER